MTPILAAWYIYALSTVFILVCIFMMLVILIQKPKGGGLSGAFGGAGGSASAAFGAKTGDVLTVITVALFVAFLLCAMGLTWAVRPAHEALMRQQQQQSMVDEVEQAAEDAVEDAMPTLPGENADARESESEVVPVAAEPVIEAAIEAEKTDTPMTDPQTPNPESP